VYVNGVRALAAAVALLLVLQLPGLSQDAEPASPDWAALASAVRSQPGDDAAKRSLEDAVCAGLPTVLDAALLPELPVSAATLPSGLGTLVVPKAYLPVRAEEPQSGLPFTKATYLYLPHPDDGRLTLFAVVHYTVPDDARLASRMAGLLSLAHRTLVQETGRPPEGGESRFDVWIVRKGDAGGEQWGRNLYFYEPDAPRSSIEWIREIVHEYSHLALPAVGGYTAPEYWANGYLGECLIIRWIERMPHGPSLVQQVWGDFSGAENFDRQLIDPDLSLYRQIGRSDKWLARTDALGMKYFIGQVLTADDKYGASTLGLAFTLLPHARAARAADMSDAIGLARAQQP
jgi:hypothetical protein